MTSAATCSPSCRRSTSATPPWATAWGLRPPRPSTARGAARHQRHRRRRLLAQRPDERRRPTRCSTGADNVAADRRQLLLAPPPGARMSSLHAPETRYDTTKHSIDERGARRRRRTGSA
ncbi:MAG: hypothetical protein U5L11_12675 [Arhodomonas sp.]|nr:hypothetical protein [Arhodomonas sp.]